MRAIAASAGLLCALAAAPALAQPAPAAASDAERAAARTLGYDGVRDFEQGRYADALGKLDRAYAVVRVQTLGLWSARAMAARGLLVEAAERYFEVARMPVREGDAAVQGEARDAATKERAALLPRIPKLRVVLSGAPPGDARVTLDGQRIHAALLGVDVGVNPGAHDVAVEGRAPVRRRVDLAEGQRLAVTLEVPAAPPGETTRASEASPGSGGPARSRSVRLTAAAVLGGAGLASLAAGGVAGGMAASRWSAAESACPGLVRCPSDAGQSLSESARVRAQVATAALGAGGVLLAGAAVLWAAAPPAAGAPAVRVGVGPRGVALGGAF